MPLVNLALNVKEVPVVAATEIDVMTDLDHIWRTHGWKGGFAELTKLRVFLATLRRLCAQDLLLCIR
jgi:hypothetical protein